jgi:hypothetical protein
MKVNSLLARPRVPPQCESVDETQGDSRLRTYSFGGCRWEQQLMIEWHPSRSRHLTAISNLA